MTVGPHGQGDGVEYEAAPPIARFDATAPEHRWVGLFESNWWCDHCGASPDGTYPWTRPR